METEIVNEFIYLFKIELRMCDLIGTSILHTLHLSFLVPPTQCTRPIPLYWGEPHTSAFGGTIMSVLLYIPYAHTAYALMF